MRLRPTHMALIATLLVVAALLLRSLRGRDESIR